MTSLRAYTLAVAVSLVGILSMPLQTNGQIMVAASGGNVLTGELVATNVSKNQFRLVGHAGSYTAPAGMSVEAWDGKPVEVEIGRDGRVLQISEAPIPIDPIAHGYQTVSGQLVVRDPAQRTFTFARDDRVYIAPAGVDLRRYADRNVEIRLDDQGQVTSLNLAALPAGAPAAAGPCSYRGQNYAEGAAVCQSGTQFRCEAAAWRDLGFACVAANVEPCKVGEATYSHGAVRCERGTQFMCEWGQWRNLGTDCNADSASAALTQRSCLFSGGTMGSGSSICRNGATLRCADGEWVNAGTPCR